MIWTSSAIWKRSVVRYIMNRKAWNLSICARAWISSTLCPNIRKTQKCRSNVFQSASGLFFSYTQIDIVEFPDESGDTIREKTFKGPLHHHLREALIYIKNSILQEQVIKVVGVAEATRFYIYPFAAIEEVLSNAVYHKGYDEREPIEVGVEANRIIIVSHPGADRWSVQKICENSMPTAADTEIAALVSSKEMHLTPVW